MDACMQDTLRCSSNNNIKYDEQIKVMKKANLVSVCAITAFYMMCGCLGYAAFGNTAPGNMLTGLGFYDPFWLIDLANIFIVLHLLEAYQEIKVLFDLWLNCKNMHAYCCFN